MIKNGFVVIATINDKIIGYLANTIKEQENYEKVQYSELNNMFIDFKYRKYGIGTKLFEKFKKYCVEKNIKDLIVTASAKNINAINFYKNIGFNEFNITLTSKIEL